jgi:hypothetical protein
LPRRRSGRCPAAEAFRNASRARVVWLALALLGGGKGPLEQIPNEVLTVENLSILSVSGISPWHLIDWEELTAKLYRDKIPAAPGLVEYARFRAGIGHTRFWLNDPTFINTVRHGRMPCPRPILVWSLFLFPVHPRSGYL